MSLIQLYFFHKLQPFNNSAPSAPGITKTWQLHQDKHSKVTYPNAASWALVPDIWGGSVSCTPLAMLPFSFEKVKEIDSSRKFYNKIFTKSWL